MVAIGDIVLYTSSSAGNPVRPAIVVQVYGPSSVSLNVFAPTGMEPGGSFKPTSVHGTSSGQWIEKPVAEAPVA